MTRRALTVIAVILLIPVVICLVCWNKWRGANQVVADYGETLDIIEYGTLTLHAAGDPDSYMAQPGVYLGKVFDRLLGAGLYTVKHDTSGEVWALVNEKGTVLFTESGTLPASAFGGEKVTRIFFDSFEHEISDDYGLEVMEGIMQINSSAMIYTPDEETKLQTYVIHLCYDGSAISTVSPGELLYFPDSGKWYYLSADAKEKSAEAYRNGDTSALEYSLEEISEGKAVRLLKSLFLGSTAGSSATDSGGIADSADK